MKRKFKNYWLRVTGCGLLVLFAFGCATTKMYALRVGMTKTQVEETVGRPENVIESKKMADGSVAEVWEYKGGRGGKKFWVYFVGGRVDSWHRAGEMWVPRPTIPKATK